MGRELTILHTEASDGWGGQEIRILSEANWMRSQGLRMVIVASPNSQLIQKASEEQFETIPLKFAKKSQLQDFIKLIRVIKGLKPDVVATHSSVDSWVGLMAGRFCKVPCTLRYRHISVPVRNNLANRWQYTRLCDHVITTADCIRKPLQETFKLSDDKITTIATGIKKPENLPHHDEAHLQVCKELKLPRSSRFIGCIAVLRSWKGHTFLMGAFEKLAGSYTDLHLVIVGDGPGREFLSRKRLETSWLERIHLIGHKTDPWLYFRAFEAAVLPSTRHEGIPQSLLQAMVAECPVVGTKIGGIPEIVSHQETGFLVAPSNSVELARAIEYILNRQGDLAYITSQARKLVEESYSLERMGNEVLKVIDKSLPRP